jgi:ATP-dependent DNA helicase RecG
LGTPLDRLRGVGLRHAPHFERLGLRTALDLLFYFPRDYQDLRGIRPIGRLEPGGLQAAVGTVVDLELNARNPRRSVLGVLLQDETGHLRCVWFNQPFMQKRFRIGQRVLVSGKMVLKGGALEVSHPHVQWLEMDEGEVSGQILPVYSLTEGLSQHQVRRAVREVLRLCGGLLEDAFSDAYRQTHRLASITEAIHNIHFPVDPESLQRAQRRFAYQELFLLQLAQALRRQQRQVLGSAPVIKLTPKINARIRRLIPFELTGAQEQAIAEIVGDLGRDFPMNRLLQGDVGSGKTIVATFAMLLVVAQGHQVVLMAPTEVLARQHFETLDRLLRNSRVRHALLTGGLPAKQRADLIQRIARGELDIVVGTQAILQGDLDYARLGLVVIDEQHKFGVRQRARLKNVRSEPHYLVMTATPIPRTITMTLFGDLDVSTLREFPPGRQPVRTYVAGEEKRARWWDFFRKQLRKGRQGYVIAPLVDESDESPAASVEETYETLANSELAEFRVGMVHGRMRPEEKAAVMEEFYRNRLHALVSTTVIEVGIDVPNATLMTIEGGERFGLSQLHQLRGRISRGKHPGYCCVFADPQTDEARQRLAAFARCADGFELAELDLAIRGPGDLLGTRQHGLPPLRVADLLRDAHVLDEARRDAAALINADPGLRRPEYARLRRMMLHRYGQALELADVG